MLEQSTEYQGTQMTVVTLSRRAVVSCTNTIHSFVALLELSLPGVVSLGFRTEGGAGSQRDGVV